MDLTSLLLSIASLSASFVAILGGFVVSRLITINSERASCSSELEEISCQLIYQRGIRNLCDTARHEEDAIRYIYDHMAELVHGEKIDDVYDETELHCIDIADLEPMWQRTLEIKQYFDECLKSKECKLNSDMIPVAVAEEYTDDPFAYELCKLYAGWGFGDHDFDNVPFHKTGAWYERNNQKALEATTQIMFLEVRETQLTSKLNALRQPVGMNAGIIIFAMFSLINIIQPLVLTLFSFVGIRAIIVASISILLLALGLIVTFVYIAWMLKWK